MRDTRSESAGLAGATTTPRSKPRLLEQVRIALRSRHYSRRTEATYVNWIKRFIFYHNKRHPKEMAETEVNQFLTYLAVKEKVSASTQNQALSALLFLYRYVMEHPLGELGSVIRARPSKRLPVVLTREEVKAVLNRLKGEQQLIAVLMYGTGMRLMECLRLRVKDIDFGSGEITIREGKGDKDRRTLLPEKATASLKDHLERVKKIHARDLADGYGRVTLPFALDRKYPNASREWGWQYVFPQAKRWVNAKTGAGASSCGSVHSAEGDQSSGASSRNCQAGNVAHAEAFVCHTFA